jgi:hypothetical protein
MWGLDMGYFRQFLGVLAGDIFCCDFPKSNAEDTENCKRKGR